MLLSRAHRTCAILYSPSYGVSVNFSRSCALSCKYPCMLEAIVLVLDLIDPTNVTMISPKSSSLIQSAVEILISHFNSFAVDLIVEPKHEYLM